MDSKVVEYSLHYPKVSEGLGPAAIGTGREKITKTFSFFQAGKRILPVTQMKHFLMIKKYLLHY
jgi:hypothetical protein